MDLSNTSHKLGLLVAVIIIAGVGFFFMKSKDTTQKSVTEAQNTKTGAETTIPAPAQAQIKVATPKVAPTGAILKTNLGDIEVAFFTKDAPKTVENFTTLSETGFYAGTKFHRVIKSFMIQGGDPLSKDDTQQARWGTGGPGYSFADEINPNKLVRGVLAMANSGPNTNGSQFFIVTAGATPWLDGHHTVFGKVVKGIDVVDKIENTATGPNDVPKTPMVVESITLK